MSFEISLNAFSRTMTMAIPNFNYERYFVYLDDLIVFGFNLKAQDEFFQKFSEITKIRKKGSTIQLF